MIAAYQRISRADGDLGKVARIRATALRTRKN